MIKNLKHRLSSNHDKKPTISNADVVEMFGNGLNNNIKLLYVDYSIVLEYKENRQSLTWQCTSQLPNNLEVPTVGHPVFYNVTQYTELLTDELQAIRDWANVRAVAATSQEDREGVAYAPKAEVKTEPKPKADAKVARGGRTVDF
jgi:hypothetical protein